MGDAKKGDEGQEGGRWEKREGERRREKGAGKDGYEGREGFSRGKSEIAFYAIPFPNDYYRSAKK